MRRIADLHPGAAKTVPTSWEVPPARDAAVVANAAQTMPHALRALQLDDQTIAELTVMSGFDDDLDGQITATSNLILACSPRSTPRWNASSEHGWTHPAVLDLPETWLNPAALMTAGKTGAHQASQEGTMRRRPARRGDLRRFATGALSPIR
jgi:hypothetical protein